VAFPWLSRGFRVAFPWLSRGFPLLIAMGITVPHESMARSLESALGGWLMAACDSSVVFVE